jgi:hypothetical protein
MKLSSRAREQLETLQRKMLLVLANPPHHIVLPSMPLLPTSDTSPLCMESESNKTKTRGVALYRLIGSQAQLINKLERDLQRVINQVGCLKKDCSKAKDEVELLSSLLLNTVPQDELHISFPVPFLPWPWAEVSPAKPGSYHTINELGSPVKNLIRYYNGNCDLNTFSK